MTDGVGGYAMGTVAGLRTRRYHGLLVVATAPPIGRMVGLVALDPVLVLGDQRIRLATHEWADGTIAPAGHLHLQSFALARRRADVAVVRRRRRSRSRTWRWCTGVRRSVWSIGSSRAPGPVRLELEALCTWRDVHGERFAGARSGDRADGRRLRVRARVPRARPGLRSAPARTWWRGDRHREEAARGLNTVEDVWMAGRFGADLRPGDALDVEAWARRSRRTAPPAAPVIVPAARAARRRGGRSARDRRRLRTATRAGGRPVRRPHAERSDGRRRLSVVRRLVARLAHFVRGPVPQHEPARRGARVARAHGSDAQRGDARQHRRRRRPRVQHRRRRAVVPPRASAGTWRVTGDTDLAHAARRRRSAASSSTTSPALGSASRSTTTGSSRKAPKVGRSHGWTRASTAAR